MKNRRRLVVRSVIALGAVALGGYFLHPAKSEENNAERIADRFTGPTSSQPLALTADDAFLAVANPDNDTVSVFDVRGDKNTKLADVRVGREPNGVAFLPNGSRLYVANTVSGTVSVLSMNRADPRAIRVLEDIPTGAEPYGLALTPNGKKLYVTNSRSNTVSVIDTSTHQVIATIDGVGFEPRGIAITNNGNADDNDETVYVTQFLALPNAGKPDGEDDSKSGFVTVISTATDAVVGTAVLGPIGDTGFKAAGDALQRIAPPATPDTADFKFITGAYPNQLNNIAIRGGFAYVPATGASPNGPTRFDVNTQSLLAAVDINKNADAAKTINMHLAVRAQSSPQKLFITQPWAIAFKHSRDEGYVVSAASNIVVKVALDRTGTPVVQNDPRDNSKVLQVKVGKNPRGIIVNAADTRAYVENYVSRDVSVLDLTGQAETVMATIRTAALPDPGSFEDLVHAGKELFHTSVGEFDPATLFGQPITGRMSNNGWGSCGACHPFGLTDNVVWIFASGPRRTIPLHMDFDPSDGNAQRALNWSGIFDEEEDFELNIRNVSGGLGLFVDTDGVSQLNPVAAFTPPNGKRPQLKIRGFGGWDAMKAYVQFGIRAPISPVPSTDPDAIDGQALFVQANCQSCHGGPTWSVSRLKFNPPPAAADISNTQLIRELRKVGTFDATQKNEVRATGAPPLGVDGFVPPSLHSLFAFPQTFFHNGSADTLDAVMANVTHRSAGTGGNDTLQDPEARRKLIRFLLSIDASTPPIN